MCDDHKTKNIAIYDARVKEHEEKFLSALPHVKPTLEKFLALIPGKNVLDLGCGPGIHAEIIAQAGFDVVCIDLSTGMVQRCKEKGLDAHVMDIEHLTFPPESFDAIWAIASLLHIPKKKMGDVLAKLHTILKKGGVLYIGVREGEDEIVEDRSDGEKFYSLWQEEELLSLLDTFTIISSEVRSGRKGDSWVEIFAKK